jgi:uncharacterized protein (DUF58 family)
MPRLRKRAAGLLAGAGILFFLGTNTQAGWLFVLAASLVGAVVAGSILPGRMLRGLTFERHAPQEIQQNDEAMVDFGVKNGSRGMRLSIAVEDPHLCDTSMFVNSIGPQESVEITTARRADHRGLLEATPIKVSTVAPFGVAERFRRVRVDGTTLVLPAVVPLGRLSFVEPAPSMNTSIHSAPRRGQGPEYFGVREYRAGDSMRHVHWPSTARTGAVMVREFEEETTRRVAIIVDACRDAGDSWTPLDRCCCAAASIALAASAQGQGVRLVLAEDGATDASARSDGRDLLHRLALLEPEGRTSLASLLGRLGDELNGIETVVVVFPTWRENDPASLVPAVGALAERFSRVVALAVEVDAQEAPRAAAPANVRAELQRGLEEAGADYRIWRPGADLSDVLAESVESADVLAINAQMKPEVHL